MNEIYSLVIQPSGKIEKDLRTQRKYSDKRFVKMVRDNNLYKKQTMLRTVEKTLHICSLRTNFPFWV